METTIIHTKEENDIVFNQIKQEQIAIVDIGLTDLLNSIKEMEKKQSKRLEKERQDEITIANKKYHEKNPNGIYLIDDVWGLIKSFIDFTPPPAFPLYKHHGLTRYRLFRPNKKYIRIIKKHRGVIRNNRGSIEKEKEKENALIHRCFGMRHYDYELFKILIEFDKYSSTRKSAKFKIRFFGSSDVNKIHNEDWEEVNNWGDHDWNNYSRAKCEWESRNGKEYCCLRIRNYREEWEELKCASFYKLPKN